MSVLICGSLAYDNIMVFPERFKDHILPDKTHMLNVAFLVPELHRNFGGCAGNIAYSLQKLGGEPVPVASVGSDFDDYAQHLDQQGIRQDYIQLCDELWTAQAYITTDLDDNQITAFHPGAMNENHRQTINADSGASFGIVAPDGKLAMLHHCKQFAEAGIPFIFDPGQGLPMFSGDELEQMIDHANWLAVNSYEWEMLKNKTGLDEKALAERLDGGMIITHGGEGSELHCQGEVTRITAIKPEKIVDPTGCGDAFRAGLLFGLERNWNAVDACRLGSLLGSLKIAHAGPQHHDFSPDSIAKRFKAEFGQPMPS